MRPFLQMTFGNFNKENVSLSLFKQSCCPCVNGCHPRLVLECKTSVWVNLRTCPSCYVVTSVPVKNGRRSHEALLSHPDINLQEQGSQEGGWQQWAGPTHTQVWKAETQAVSRVYQWVPEETQVELVCRGPQRASSRTFPLPPARGKPRVAPLEGEVKVVENRKAGWLSSHHPPLKPSPPPVPRTFAQEMFKPSDFQLFATNKMEARCSRVVMV